MYATDKTERNKNEGAPSTAPDNFSNLVQSIRQQFVLVHLVRMLTRHRLVVLRLVFE